MKKTRISIIIVTMILVTTLCTTGYAAKEKKYTLTNEKDRVKTQHDGGYYVLEEIGKDDPHYGWGLGTFYIQGFTDVIKEEDGTPVFLKNVGDELILGFDLKQNINALGKKKEAKISEDTNGFDRQFEVDQTNFGKGCLIVLETDYKNETHKPAVYTNYLTAVQNKTANTKVKPFAEGDYIVALDYELQYPGFLGGNAFNDYCIQFQFKIRNSNCMVFFYKLGEIQDEITNGAVAEDGFKIDFKNSYFLNVKIEKEMLVENDGVLTLDTRFNRAVADQSEYKEEGLYTITVSNQYTNEKVTKIISVGHNKILNVYAAYNGRMDLNEIARKLDEGVEINEQWLMILPEAKAEDSYNSQRTNYKGFGTTTDAGEKNGETDKVLAVPVNIGIFALAVIILIIAIRAIDKRRKETGSDSVPEASEANDAPARKNSENSSEKDRDTEKEDTK